MSGFTSILKFFKAELSKTEFMDNYYKDSLSLQEGDDEASIFDTNSTDSTVEQVFDMVDLNHDGKIDDGEMKELAALDTTDGDNKLTEADMKKLYENMAIKANDEINDIIAESPEEMYAKNVESGNMTSLDYLQTLDSQIDMLEGLIELREQNSKTIIDDLQAQIDKLLKGKQGKFKKEYQTLSNKRKKVEQDIENINIQLKQNEKLGQRYKEEVELINAEIEMLNPETDADKIKAKQDEISQLNKKSKENNNTIKNYKNGLENLNSELTNVNAQLGNITDKITENNQELKSKVKILNNKIKQEKDSLKQEVDGYKAKIELLKQAQMFAVDKVVADNAGNYVPEEYYDKDTSNFSYDSKALKQKWSKSHPWLSDGFYNKATEVAKRVGCDPDVLLAVMDSESGIKANVQNKSGGAAGLIQFMPKTAVALGTTTDKLKNMSAEQQLNYVEKCLLSSKKMAGFKVDDKLDSGTMYALVFLPAYAKRDVLAVKGHKYYNCNAGLDQNKDGVITKQDLAVRVRKRIPA